MPQGVTKLMILEPTGLRSGRESSTLGGHVFEPRRRADDGRIVFAEFLRRGHISSLFQLYSHLADHIVRYCLGDTLHHDVDALY